jgi:hypothetical protein
VPAQWDPSIATTDAVFGTNAAYIDQFNRSMGYTPTYNAASGTAAMMALYAAASPSLCQTIPATSAQYNLSSVASHMSDCPHRNISLVS